MFRRSTRIRHPPITFSPSTRNSAVSVRTVTNAQSGSELRVPYALNRDKALKKKSEATNREITCNIEPKRGGNFVINLSTAVYEIVKRAILQHYSQNYAERSEITSKKDENNSIVEHIVTLYKDNKKSKKNKLYTINLYHTTSRILTNGHHPSICIDHIQNILAEINEDEIKHLNERIREKCHEAARSKDETEVQTQATTGNNAIPALPLAIHASTQDSILQENIDERNTENEDNDTVACPHCNQPAQNESIECTTCSQWVHYECEGLNLNKAREYSSPPTYRPPL